MAGWAVCHPLSKCLSSVRTGNEKRVRTSSSDALFVYSKVVTIVPTLRRLAIGCGSVQGLRSDVGTWERSIEDANLNANGNYLKNSTIYLIAVKTMITTSIHLIFLAGTNFWQRAPRYIPAMPPRPKRMPKSQSGATDTWG